MENKDEIDFIFTNAVMDKKAFLEEFRKYFFKKFDKMMDGAAHYGVSVQFTSMMLSGKRPIPDTILEGIGFTKVLVRSYAYSPVEMADVVEENTYEEERRKITELLIKHPLITLEGIEGLIETEEQYLVFEDCIRIMIRDGKVVYSKDTNRIALKENEHLLG